MRRTLAAEILKVSAALVVGLFLACASAQMVESRGKSAFAPQGEREGGRVRYLFGGAEFVISARRENAYRQMYERCNGSYEISREWDETGATVTSVYGQSSTTSNAWGSGSATSYGNNTYGRWNGTGTSAANAQALAVSGTEIWRNIEFACLPRVGPSTPQPLAPAPQALANNREAEFARIVSQLVAFLSLETGCPAATIAHVGSTGTAHRLLACGHAFVCVEGDPTPSCRPALVNESDDR